MVLLLYKVLRQY